MWNNEDYDDWYVIAYKSSGRTIFNDFENTYSGVRAEARRLVDIDGWTFAEIYNNGEFVGSYYKGGEWE